MSGTIVPSYAANAYLYGSPGQQVQPAQSSSILPFLLRAPPPAPSPLVNPASNDQAAVDALLQISSGGTESGTPAGAPAAPGSALDAGRGLGQFGSFAGTALGPVGQATFGALGSGIGNAVAASRAQDIADIMGLDQGQLTSPASAFGRGFGRSALAAAPGVLGVPFGGLVGRALSGTVSSYDARGELQDALDRALATELTEPDEYSAAVTRGLQQQLFNLSDEAMRGVDFGMDIGHVQGFNPSYASMDYYSTGFEGMGGETGVGGHSEGPASGPSDAPSEGGFGAAKQGGLATFEGFKGPEHFAQGGQVIELQGGGKIAVGPGSGLDDLIPTSIEGRRAAALSDGEFVFPADVVSMMGDGSSNAGARRLYDLVRQIRQNKTGTSEQAGPLPVGDLLKRVMR